MKHVPQVLEIKDIIEETPTIKTFIFDWTMIGEKIPSPGQFVMVWNFHDEKPMSISYINEAKDEIGITVKKVGEFTENLHTLQVGDKLGLRGPYGNGFDTDLEGMKVLAIGGGVGMAPIAAFTEEALKNKAQVMDPAVSKDLQLTGLLSLLQSRNTTGPLFVDLKS